MGSGDGRYLGAKWSSTKLCLSILLGSYSVARIETPAMDPNIVVKFVLCVFKISIFGYILYIFWDCLADRSLGGCEHEYRLPQQRLLCQEGTNFNPDVPTEKTCFKIVRV